MQSVSDKLPALLEKYRVLIYNGQYDFICNLVGVQDLYYNLDWSGKQAFQQAARTSWFVEDSKVGGFVRSAKTLTQLILIGAG